MINNYRALKDRQQKESNDFPMMFAFSKEQFKKGMEQLGLNEEDTDKIYSIGGGGYIRKESSKDLSNLISRHESELKKAIDEDMTGEGFIFDMFYYELGNHEYSYTMELDDTLEALGLKLEEIQADTRLSRGLELACKKQMENDYF